MTRVSCVSRAKRMAWKMDGESDLDEFLCGVDNVISVSKNSKLNKVGVAARDFKLNFYWGDWVVADENETNFITYNDDDFRKAFEIDGNAVAY